jgi:outer membrane receptor for monomeric catechols
MGDRMPAKSLRLAVIAALCVSQGAFAASSKRPQHASPTAPATDPAAPYKADRLSSSHGETILNTPGQTTVLTRQVLDDKNATSLRDAMRSTAGVTIGR